jgi:hypothetical protein
MKFEIDWSLSGEPILLSELSRITGKNAEYIRQAYRNGDLGPVPDVSAQIQKVPLYHVAALLVLEEIAKLNVATRRASAVLPAIAGAAYVRFALLAVATGRCIQRGGTPALNNQLWAGLRGEGATASLEEKLPGGPTKTKRYLCFGDSSCFVCDDLEEVDVPLASLKIVDAWSIAEKMKQHLPGPLFATQIA